MKNIPEVKLGIVAVSRDCFPMSLSESRRIKVCQEYKKAYGDIYECPTVVENENDMLKALDEVNAAGCNALVVYLGNFGPESSETLLAKKFGGSESPSFVNGVLARFIRNAQTSDSPKEETPDTTV